MGAQITFKAVMAWVHSPKQIAEIAASITAFGFNNPVLLDKHDGIVAGHSRVEAAKLNKFQATRDEPIASR